MFRSSMLMSMDELLGVLGPRVSGKSSYEFTRTILCTGGLGGVGGGEEKKKKRFSSGSSKKKKRWRARAAPGGAHTGGGGGNKL